MKKCKFKLGDHVDINMEASLRDRTLLLEVRFLLYEVFEARKELENWTVFYCDFDKRVQEWMIWIESRGGNVKKIEQRRLIDRTENFKTTKAAIQKGKTAREILGLSQAR